MVRGLCGQRPYKYFIYQLKTFVVCSAIDDCPNYSNTLAEDHRNLRYKRNFNGYNNLHEYDLPAVLYTTLYYQAARVFLLRSTEENYSFSSCCIY